MLVKNLITIDFNLKLSTTIKNMLS